MTQRQWVKKIHNVEAPGFSDNRQMTVARLLALRAGRLYPSGEIPDTHIP